MHRTKEMKLTGSVEPKHALISPQQPGSASYLQKSFTFSIQPYQVAFVVSLISPPGIVPYSHIGSKCYC